MPSRRTALPTDAELQVLRVLWSRGPSTVHEVHDALSGPSRTGYTTTLKLLQNLYGKSMVIRDGNRRQHVYAAAAREEDTLQHLVRRLIDRSFEGSATALAMHALGAKRASAAELAEVKAMIKRLEREEGAG